MKDLECKECGKQLSFLAGCPAHHSKTYCDNCGWKAWETFSNKTQEAILNNPKFDIDKCL